MPTAFYFQIDRGIFLCLLNLWLGYLPICTLLSWSSLSLSPTHEEVAHGILHTKQNPGHTYLKYNITRPYLLEIQTIYNDIIICLWTVIVIISIRVGNLITILTVCKSAYSACLYSARRFLLTTDIIVACTELGWSLWYNYLTRIFFFFSSSSSFFSFLFGLLIPICLRTQRCKETKTVFWYARNVDMFLSLCYCMCQGWPKKITRSDFFEMKFILFLIVFLTISFFQILSEYGTNNYWTKTDTHQIRVSYLITHPKY